MSNQPSVHPQTGRSHPALPATPLSTKVVAGPMPPRPKPSPGGLGGWILGLLLAASLIANAEDADRYRTYLHWRVGEFAPAWGCWTCAAYGANFNQNWGGELALDFWQLNLEGPGGEDSIGETAMWNLAPQLRFRVPLWNDRVVPYAVADATSPCRRA